MATGETHSGKVRVEREDTEGNRKVVAGPYQQDRVDYTNNSVDAEEKLYVNTNRSDRVTRPAGAEDRDAPDAIFAAGEVLYVAHEANSTVTNDIDVSADTFAIDILRLDRNRGRIFPDTLTQSDQELSTDPAESTSGYVDFYQFTVPDRQEVRIAGAFEAVAVEN